VGCEPPWGVHGSAQYVKEPAAAKGMVGRPWEWLLAIHSLVQ